MLRDLQISKILFGIPLITLIITSVSKNSFAAPPCSGDSWVFHKQGKKSKSKKSILELYVWRIFNFNGMTKEPYKVKLIIFT